MRSQFLDAEILSWHAQACMHACVRANGNRLVKEIDDICLITNLFFTYDWITLFLSICSHPNFQSFKLNGMAKISSEIHFMHLIVEIIETLCRQSIHMCVWVYIKYIVSHALGHCKYLLHPVHSEMRTFLVFCFVSMVFNVQRKSFPIWWMEDICG